MSCTKAAAVIGAPCRENRGLRIEIEAAQIENILNRAAFVEIPRMSRLLTSGDDI